MASTKKPIIRVKQGDDFSIDLTVKDTNNTTSLNLKAELDLAIETYNAAIAAIPPVPDDISTATAALDLAQIAYDESIIVDITFWEISSDVTWCGKVISSLIVDMTDPTLGMFALAAPSTTTALWKPRTYTVDVQFVTNLFGKQSSQTFLIEVERDVTNG